MTLPPLTLDRVSPAEARRQRQAFVRARKVETSYARQLRRMASHIGDIVRAYMRGGADRRYVPALQRALERYSTIIHPWAEAAAGRAIAEVAQREERAWAQVAQGMSTALQRELREAPTGQALRQYLSEQVHLITSLPIDAVQRVHELTIEAMGTGGPRAAEIAEMIARTGDVTKARANLIARTEMARTQTGLTMVRAKSIGSSEYIWRTARDAAVRPSHRRLEGRTFRWDAPPICDPPNHRANPGSIWNCRCYAEPILPNA